MGVESIVYQYIPESFESLEVRNVLVNIGAEVINENHLVLRGPRHWIDVQVGIPEPVASFRLAVCNPLFALDVLKSTFESLLDADGGEVVDVEGDQRMSSMTKEDWHKLLARFELRKEEFQRNFGVFQAAISADEVFDYLESLQP